MKRANYYDRFYEKSFLIVNLNATQYANRLLKELGSPLNVTPSMNEHPSLAWRRAGMMEITGMPEDPIGLTYPLPLATIADGAMLALRCLVPDASLPKHGSVLLGERSRIRHIKRNGRIAPNNACHFFNTSDGHIALTLARDEDWELIPALLQGKTAHNLEELAKELHTQHTEDILYQGRELGLAIAANTAPLYKNPWYKLISKPKKTAIPPSPHPLVIDLSSLWAGPLIGNLLHKIGARVIKVESLTRPDGARKGHQEFYTLLNEGKESIALDFTTLEGQKQLQSLIKQADIVIESSRPRALRQIGIDIMKEIHTKSNKVWLSLTAYGRDPQTENWIGFGDDIAVSAGVSYIMQHVTGKLMFVGDALSDPMTGIHATLATWYIYQNGGGIIDIALHNVISHVIAADSEIDIHILRQRTQHWQNIAKSDKEPYYPLRRATTEAHTLGKDTQSILQEFNIC